MGPHVIVLVTELIEPELVCRIGLAPPDGSLQRSMHALDFALCLRMPEAAVQQAHALLQNPDREFGDPTRTGMIPPGNAMVHQQGIRQTNLFKGSLQRFSHALGPRAPEVL